MQSRGSRGQANTWATSIHLPMTNVLARFELLWQLADITSHNSQHGLFERLGRSRDPKSAVRAVAFCQPGLHHGFHVLITSDIVSNRHGNCSPTFIVHEALIVVNFPDILLVWLSYAIYCSQAHSKAKLPNIWGEEAVLRFLALAQLSFALSYRVSTRQSGLHQILVMDFF